MIDLRWKLLGAGGSTDLETQRAAFEALLAHFDMPAGLGMRPTNAGGVPALVVDEEFAEPLVVLYQRFRIGRGNR